MSRGKTRRKGATLEFDAGEKDAGAAKILEAEHRSGSSFNGTVVLLVLVQQRELWGRLVFSEKNEGLSERAAEHRGVVCRTSLRPRSHHPVCALVFTLQA